MLESLKKKPEYKRLDRTNILNRRDSIIVTKS